MAMKHFIAASSAALLVLTARTNAQSSASACPSPIAPKNAAPSVASGFRVEVVASGLRDPRGIMFDSSGGLLVLEQSHGVSRLKLSGDGACVKAEGDVQRVVENEDVSAHCDLWNVQVKFTYTTLQLLHGLELSQDGKTLYASSQRSVFSWDYDASAGRTTSDPKELVTGMDFGGDGHVTRTLLLSKKVPGQLLVSRGSVGNIDPQTLDINSGVSTIKAFEISNVTSPYQHNSTGTTIGWGLRNSVGVAEDPASGAIYSVENSVDNIERSGQNVHENNPGEELNYHGFLNETDSKERGANYGYPTCFAAWQVSEIPDFKGQTGQQFAMGDQNSTLNDTTCGERMAPRITFQAHMAPLDIKFNPEGTAAWVTFHGSWNRESPIGYKLSLIEFNGRGEPTAPSNSTTATSDIVSNPDLSKCPGSCFRPVGLAWDSKGRLFMTSDSTGEIYVVTKTDGSGVADVKSGGTRSGNGGPSGTQSGSGPGQTSENAAVRRWTQGSGGYWVAGAAVVGAMPML